MRTVLLPSIFMLIFILISCKKNQDQSMIGNREKKSICWKTLRIESQNQVIVIDKYENYGVRDTCDLKGVRINESVIEYRPINRGQEYFDITEQEKDSVFYYIYDIVTNPVYREQFATCYVGNISIGFSTGSATQLCKYNSVGNWTTISLSTEKLYNLLRRKTKISKY